MRTFKKGTKLQSMARWLSCRACRNQLVYKTKSFIKQKVNYIHNNPVKDKTVALPEDYYFSSARNYAGLYNDLEIVLLDLF